jgi:2-keto-4-pentenoate hydratase/2-oxohepta-3-ene-1,7-dioic acid hydratase in catechol pathway
MSATLVRFKETKGQSDFRPGLMVGDSVVDISGRYPSKAVFLKQNPNGWNPDKANALDGATSFRRDSVTLGPPIDPGRMIFAVGANYRQHAEEAGLGVPKTPVIFFKPYPSLVGPGEPIVVPAVSSKLDYEGEMAVVIGRDATKVSRADAPNYVAAVTIVNDTTARDLQWVDLGKNRIVDWFASKALDRTSPVGPNLTSIKSIPDVHKMALKTTLNGKVMQDADTGLMVYDTWQLIEFISARGTLRAGDIIATGTPFGVGGFREIFLKAGDVVRVELQGVGVLENPVTHA